MIETNETGEKILRELVDKVDQGDFADHEVRFIKSLEYRDYAGLSVKQKAWVTELYEEVK